MCVNLSENIILLSYTDDSHCFSIYVSLHRYLLICCQEKVIFKQAFRQRLLFLFKATINHFRSNRQLFSFYKKCNIRLWSNYTRVTGEVLVQSLITYHLLLVKPSGTMSMIYDYICTLENHVGLSSIYSVWPKNSESFQPNNKKQSNIRCLQHIVGKWRQMRQSDVIYHKFT